MIEEKIENQPQSNEENKPKSDPSLIEIDGTVEAAEKVKPLSAQEKKNKLKEMKAKKEAEYKAKQKEEKLRLKEQKKLEKKAQGGGKKISKGLIIIISLFIVLNGVFAFLYFKKPDLLKKLIPGKHKEKVTLVNSDSTVASETGKNQEDTLSLAAEEQNAEATETKKEEKAEPVVESAPKVAPAKEFVSETETKSNQAVKSKPAKVEKSAKTTFSGKTTKLNGPCWIVSFSSVKDEGVASKGVKKLVDKGFLAGYYWMPDIDPGAKQLFKVYSGPFTSEAEARIKQREIVVLNEDAYVMKLNK